MEVSVVTNYSIYSDLVFELLQKPNIFGTQYSNISKKMNIFGIRYSVCFNYS